MTNQILQPELFVDLSTAEQEVLSGGYWVCRKWVWKHHHGGHGGHDGHDGHGGSDGEG